VNYKLHAPLAISGRLLPAAPIGDSWLSVDCLGSDDAGRFVFAWYLDGPNSLRQSGRDLSFAASRFPNPGRALAELLGFLENDIDADQDPIFSSAVRDWARAHRDEIVDKQQQLEADANWCCEVDY
jgi:hypothetical protein